MQKSNWKEFDFKVASDYTYGSPEKIRKRLRKKLGLPILLPGEKNVSQGSDNKIDSSKISSRRNL